MGSRLNQRLLATLVMDNIEMMTITADLSIYLFTRYVDDIFILTKFMQQLKIFNKFNEQHSDIKFTIEHHSSNYELTLKDLKVMFANDKATFNYYEKILKRICFQIFVMVCVKVRKWHILRMNINVLLLNVQPIRQKEASYEFTEREGEHFLIKIF